MFKKNQLIKFSAVLVVFAFTAGGIKTIAEQRPSSREGFAGNISVIADSSNYDDTSSVLNRSITFERQHEAMEKAKAQQVLAASLKSNTKTVSASTAKSKSTSSKTSTKTSTAVAKTVTARSKTVVSRGTSSASKGLEIVSLAKKYLGYQYTYGGSSPSTGFDCSGFTMYIYSKLSVSLSHSSSQQYNQGTRISSVKDLKPGDLVFFYSPIGHVGIYIGNGQFIHASNPKSDVEITSLDSTPYNKEFVGAVRIFN